MGAAPRPASFGCVWAVAFGVAFWGQGEAISIGFTSLMGYSQA